MFFDNRIASDVHRDGLAAKTADSRPAYEGSSPSPGAIRFRSVVVSTTPCHGVSGSSNLLGTAKRFFIAAYLDWPQGRLITFRSTFDSCLRNQLFGGEHRCADGPYNLVKAARLAATVRIVT